MKTNLTILTIGPLNLLGKRLGAKSRTTDDIRYIVDNLDDFIEQTRPPKPRGKIGKDYRLHVHPNGSGMDAKSSERRLEAGLHEKFSAVPVSGSRSEVFLKGVARISSFQVPLYSAQKKKGWGSIDVLGVDDSSGYPVVIELKISKPAIEPLLRAVVEALTYMIALRKNWDDFRPFWKTHTGRDLPSPSELTAVVLAPTEYWEKVHDKTDHHFGALQSLAKLSEELAKRGYLVRFASIAATDSRNGSKWSITGSAQEKLL